MRLSAGLFFLALVIAAPVAAAPSRDTIYIQPLGRTLADVDVKFVRAALVAFYGLEVKLLPRIPLPKSAYYRPRRRYRAERLLTTLRDRLPPDGKRILGLTRADISTTKGRYRDWGVIGLASVDGVACVISSFRARKKARNRAHTRVRLAKVAVHEVGHTLGLFHCPNRACIMEDARGKVTTTDREYDLCGACRAKVAAKGHRIPKAPLIPWPKPRGDGR